MSNVKGITAVLLVASMATGCSAINNARSGYQAYQSYQTAKGMRGAEPAFIDASAFTVTADLIPRDENTASQVNDAFVQLVAENTKSVADELDVNISYCETNCPADTINVQFKEKGRDGAVEKFAMGDKIGGDLYLTKREGVIEEYTLDMSEDYAKMAQMLATAINVRLMKTAQVSLKKAYDSGELSKKEMQKESEALVEFMNKRMELEGPLLEQLKNKA